jgi:hypothetical protein
VGIVRGKLYASILVIPQRKLALVEAFHGTAAMAGLELKEGSHGEGRGKGGGKRQGAQLGGHGEELGG